MNVTSVASRLSTGLVALVAGYASFSHIYAVARSAGEHVSVASVLPLSIDGLILVGTLAMLDDKHGNRKPRLSARLSVTFGIIATLAANIASAQPTWTARAVAAVPPVAFLLAVEVLSRRGKVIHPEPAEQVESVTIAEPVAVEPEPVAEPVAVEQVEPAKVEPVERTRKPSTKPAGTSADRVMSAHLAEPEATHPRIAQLAGVSVATVKRYRPSRSARRTVDLAGVAA
ncbi:hypothetical protein AWW66_27725 [Micromonospora rosaria]|uniref:DUF2637 domain-containing protein n=1 Tax=Micromonospora rosaria TaxID=47874 RepID=A0A136PK58_9ACTN|nr:DUF2637 domain-containing protein [Micromonospora rosaria]KXK58810.1 hypothetical protein AWW66_27725 [Micromonospora rosaria]